MLSTSIGTLQFQYSSTHLVFIYLGMIFCNVSKSGILKKLCKISTPLSTVLVVGQKFTFLPKSANVRGCIISVKLLNVFHVHSLKEFLPKEYIKQRGSEKKIFQVCPVHSSYVQYVVIKKIIFTTVGEQYTSHISCCTESRKSLKTAFEKPQNIVIEQH